MSWSNVSFLLSVEPGRVPPPGRTLDDLAFDIVRRWRRRLRRRFDDQGFPVRLVLDDGRIHLYEPDISHKPLGRYRSTDLPPTGSWSAHELMSFLQPDERRWTEAVRHAAQCVAVDTGLWGSSPFGFTLSGDPQPYERIDVAPADEIFAGIREMKRSELNGVDWKTPPAHGDLGGYILWKRAIAVQCFERSSLFPPFSRAELQAAHYRAWDFRTHIRNDDRLVILNARLHS